MDIEKEKFEFSYSVPSLDWFEIKKVTIKPDDYCYFRLERRFGPSWWLIGSNPPKDKQKIEWEDTQIGELEKPADVIRFIEWAKQEKGSKLIEVKAICGSFDIIEEILKFKEYFTKKVEKEGIKDE